MITGTDFLIWANNCLATIPKIEDHGFREAMCRSIVSRSYYAVFHTAREYAESKEYERDDERSSHDSLWRWFHYNNHAGIAGMAQGLKGARHAADYKLELHSNELTAQQQYDQAALIIGLVASLH